MNCFFVSGAGNSSSGGSDTSGNGYGDVSTNTNNSSKSIGLPKTDLSETPGWGAALGTMIGARVAGTKGSEAGFIVGHAVENFDWEWYRKYRKVAESYEIEYSGGLP